MDKSKLREILAEAIHNDWVGWKRSQGFTYSEKQDYNQKTHPHCREWSELPDSHKESDYRASDAVIKILISNHLLKD